MELTNDFDSNISYQNDLSKENEQQMKTIRHLQTRIKLLEKSQNDFYKSTNQIERENKTIKSQVRIEINEFLKLFQMKNKRKVNQNL